MTHTDLNKIKLRYGIVGQDEKTNKALDTALQIAPTHLSVLIQGESGVGKEVIPRIIHDNSPRRGKRYIAINCGSIPEGTIDSELFGHEKGAFTGAMGEREGYFGAASGGTLFLDEVGELPMSTQARLLRVLETGEYLRVGSSSPRTTDVRVIAATNVNIPNAIRERKFREDLYYRLCTINISIPPLRERGRDSVLLFKKFALDTAERYQIPIPLSLTPQAEDVIAAYKWPGNVRQLKNVAEQMSILCQDRVVGPQQLAQYGVVPNLDPSTSLARQPGGESSSGQAPRDYENEIKMLASAVIEIRREVNEIKSQMQFGNNRGDGSALPILASHIAPHAGEAATQPLRQEAGMATARPIDDDEIAAAELIVEHYTEPAAHHTNDGAQSDDNENLNLMEMEKRLIKKALQRHHYHRKNVADDLGISERTLYRKIKEYGFDV